MWVKDHHLGDHPLSEHGWGEGEEKDGSGQFKEEGKHPLQPQIGNYCVVIIILFSSLYVRFVDANLTSSSL